MSESIYLREAIEKVNYSEGDVGAGYQEILIRQADLRLKISIARSLERIADMLEEMNDRAVTNRSRGERGLVP